MPARSAMPWLALAGVVVGLDQLTKMIALVVMRFGETRVVTSFWNWVLVYNPGAAFSFLSDAGGWQRWFFTALSLVVSLWLVAMLRSHHRETRLALALSLVLGGALGNVIDRVQIGAVVDFIQWHVGEYYWPSFNLADSAITLGAVLLVWDQLRAKPGAGNTVEPDPKP